MTGEDFVEWRQHPVTHEFLLIVKQRLQDIMEEMSYLNSDSKHTDYVFRTGACWALRDVLDIKPEENNGT